MSGDQETKAMDLINYFDIDKINPHILFFSEHHIKELGLLHITLIYYMLG
jgi:hypothetical protein